jgi:alcohol dehydrogenase class IV
LLDKRVFEFPIYYTTVIGQIAIGWGVHETVANECKNLKITRALITTTGLKGTGILETIKQILETQGISTVVYDKVTSNHKDFEVMDAYKVFIENKCDGVVSVGGGSSHDCGKGVRAVATNNGKYICDMAVFIDPPWLEKYMKAKPVTIPQIAVNTTAGTGAETSSPAAIINTKVKAKQLIMIPGLGSNIALFDPLLVRLMPRQFIIWTGIDALTHAVESFTCRTRSQYNLGMQLHAYKLVMENLREFAYNHMNHVACENMCYAASMAGFAIGYGGGIGMVHGLGHGFSSLYDHHHGHANGALLIPVERYNQPSCHEKFAELAAAAGIDTRGMTKSQASDKWFDETSRFLQDLNIQTGHLKEQFGLKKEDIEYIVKWQYEKDFCREGNPRDFVFEDCVKLLESLM